ncbi:MAG: hypothetical protein HY825_15835 [Acidobacteria bacterium]|nr:hypothetical protein [Acidobacteriota bacterium]
MTIRYQDVFVPGGFPNHTYNPRIDLRLEEQLREVKDNLCKLATVTGQTKSGKTVLARRVLPREDSVWVDGGSVSVEDDFWQVVLEQLDLFNVTESRDSTETAGTVSGRASAGASFIVAKGTAEVGGEMRRARSVERARSRSVSGRVAAVRGLTEAHLPLVIDDFHYLSRELQGSIVRALKQPVFDGLPVAIIAIPHRRYDALKVEKEMTGRISPVDVPAWTDAELEYIPLTGFRLLDVEPPPEFPRALAAEAIGSPHLMQDFCRVVCRLARFESPHPDQRLRLADVDLKTTFREVAETIGRPVFEKLARGPRQRTDRIERELKDGRLVDIYQLVLYALAHIRPGLVSLEYEDLRTAIREVSASQIPQLQEVSRVLKHMATIAASDQSSTPVIDFEEDDTRLHITDPFFAFYLRWGDLAV